MKYFLAFSLLVNVSLATRLYTTITDYEPLQAWACEHGNGGYACGEE